MKQLLIILTFILFISISPCKSQSCEDLPDKFSDFTEAISSIKETTFKFTDELPSGKSSWIMEANYYSCDGYYGYLVFTTDKYKDYVHENVPLSIWKQFKNATSSGSYYVENIKHKYRLIPE